MTIIRCVLGSSPHTRGARTLKRRAQSWTRIIPAYAGSTREPVYLCSNVWDHPRIRGEHSSFPESCICGVGSSPHTRGAQTTAVTVDYATGIIPAYAGSTIPFLALLMLSWDHPRIRGEHLDSAVFMRFCRGSSPHTRGAHDEVSGFLTSYGIIPAYAGSTSQTM